MSIHRNLMTVCFAAVFALGLAACSSSSDDPPMTGDGDGMEMPDPAIAQRAAIKSAIDAANTAVGMVNDDAADATVTAADNAIAAAKKAIMDAADVPAEEKAANSGTVSAIETALTNAKASRMAAMEAAAEEERKAMAAAGKALHGALGANPLDFLDDDAAVSLSSSGLAVNPNGTADDADGLAEVTLKAGDSAGALGSWNGTNYAHTDAGTKVSNTAVVFTNRGAPTTKTFASEYGTGNPSADDGTYDATTRRLTITVATAGVAAKVKSSRFPTVGAQNYPPAVSGGSDVSFSGMYDGASGTYLCTSADAGAGCSAAVNATGGITLTGTWIFTHAASAMVSRPDPNYLYFGWWLRKDKDDKPTTASAFVGVVGDVDGTVDLTDPATLAGTATYSGHAAGKFAINNPLGGSDAGHFTADATLTAKFGATTAPTNGGVTGTIDNFMANEQAVPWSVKLNRAAWDGTTAGAFASTADTTNTTAEGTVWSIDGNSASESGMWSGQMYDEATTGAANDGSNVPTTAVGTFQSMFGSTHTMVGAFGATKD